MIDVIQLGHLGEVDLQLIEMSLSFFGPFPNSVLFQERKQRSDFLRVIWNARRNPKAGPHK